MAPADERQGEVAALVQRAGARIAEQLARRMAASSVSRIDRLKAPTQVDMAPGFSQAPGIRGSLDSVAQETMSASRTARFEPRAGPGGPPRVQAGGERLGPLGPVVPAPDVADRALRGMGADQEGRQGPAPTMAIREASGRAR